MREAKVEGVGEAAAHLIRLVAQFAHQTYEVGAIHACLGRVHRLVGTVASDSRDEGQLVSSVAFSDQSIETPGQEARTTVREGWSLLGLGVVLRHLNCEGIMIDIFIVSVPSGDFMDKNPARQKYQLLTSRI